MTGILAIVASIILSWTQQQIPTVKQDKIIHVLEQSYEKKDTWDYVAVDVWFDGRYYTNIFAFKSETNSVNLFVVFDLQEKKRYRVNEYQILKYLFDNGHVFYK